MKKYLSSFVCGFGAGVLQIVPVAKSFACCFILPVASYFALYLEQKATKDYSKILSGKAVMIGAITGLYAALFGSVFDIMITFITKNNDILAALPEIQKMIHNFPFDDEMKSQLINMLTGMMNQISETGFSLLYTITILINNLIINTIFGIVGGLVGAQILNSRNKKLNSP